MQSGLKHHASVIHISWLLWVRSLTELSWVLSASEPFQSSNHGVGPGPAVSPEGSAGEGFTPKHVVVLGFHSLLETTVGSMPRGLLRDSSSRHSSTGHQTQQGRESASKAGVIILRPLITGVTSISFATCIVCVLSHVRLFVTPWTVAHQAPLSMEFSRLKILE